MKKLICLLLVICMLCPILSGCVYFDKYLMIKKAYLEQFEIKDKKPEDVIVDYDGGTYNGARIVMLDTEWHDAKEWTEIVDETTVQYYDTNRLYAYQNGKFFTLTDAYDKDKLSSEDILAIVEEFNKKVTHFRDTCDIYDFKKFEYWDNLELGEPYGKTPVSNMIGVDIDIRICTNNNTSNDFDVVEYLGADIISNVHGIARFNNLWRFYLKTTNDKLENIPTIIERLKKIPGVLGAGYYWSFYDPGSSSLDNSYNSNQVGWGLYDIKVEKVWNFTMVLNSFVNKL